MKTITLRFSECEHQGDMDNYFGDILDAGGKPSWNSIEIDHDAEEGSIEVEVQDMEAFNTKLKETDCYDFII
jgi:hypothetical protein